MNRSVLSVSLLVICIFISTVSYTFAQTNMHDLRRLTDEEWLSMTTEERLDALNTSNNRAQNKTFFGDFNTFQNLYNQWGYDYYEMNDQYENYAFRGFESYNIVEDRRLRWYYNRFGDRLTKMTRNGAIFSETHYDDGTSDYGGASGFINSQLGGRGTTGGIDGIWVARESTDDWAISAVGAGALRAKLTPLTISVPNAEGSVLNFQSKNYQARFIHALRSSVSMDANSGQVTGDMTDGNPLLLRGGQIKRKFGALTLGANYANLYHVQNTREGGTSLKGHVSDFAPTPMIYFIRVIDDSPQDGEGPTVQDVTVNVNGKPRPDIIPSVILDDFDRELITAIDSKAEYQYLEPSAANDKPVDFDIVSVDYRMPKYLDYIYYSEYMQGTNTDHLIDTIDLAKMKEYYSYVSPTEKIQVSGSEYVVYMFDLITVAEDVNRVQVEMTVSNDYRVQTSQVYTKNKNGGHDFKGDNKNHYVASYWQTRAQADGNIKDFSNLRTISIDFGYEVANIIWGFDAQFNYLGFNVNAEWVANTHYWMFADGTPGDGVPISGGTDISERVGHRSSQTDHSYYLTVQKDWEKFGFAGEIFKMGKFYRPYMMSWLNSDVVGSGAGANVNCRNNYVFTPMIDDNDDNDAYPDIPHKSRVMAISMQSLVDPDGVFPGNDLDHDGLPDNDKNYNNYPDYNEPFLMFDVDPDEFVFGDDFNNNNIPDFREDDLKVDTPYDLDRQGHHFYLRYSPQRNVNLYLGSMKTGGVGTDTKTDIDYFKFNFNYDVFSVGNIFAEYRYERIKDNIQDKFVVVSTELTPQGATWYRLAGYTSELFYDEVEFRNSKVNKLFLESRLRPISSITIENHVKYVRNDQVEGSMYDGTFQPADILSTMAMVNKFVYTKRIGNWTFSPGMKLRFYKKSRSESLNPLDHYMMSIPLVFLKYNLTQNTAVTWGMQGMYGLETTLKDYVQSRNDFKQVNYVLQVENRTTYMGFEIWGGFGFQLEELKYDEPFRKFEEQKKSSFFVRMWLGY